MRVRDHVALSTAACAPLATRLGARRVAVLWAGSIFIDVDHYLWHCAHTRCVDPWRTVRYFNGADVPRRRRMRLLHSPLAVLATLVLGTRLRPLLPAALGMAAHVGIDSLHERGLSRARARALARDRCVCRACGESSREVVTHLWHQPLLLPSLSPGNLVSLCRECHLRAHVRAHARPREIGSWR